jgi:hypothetical protein
MFFLLGSLCFKLGVFDSRPTGKRLYYFICATIWIPMNVYIITLINFVLNPGNYIVSESIDVILLWTGFHLSALGMLYVTVNTFRYYLNRKGKIMNLLNSCSYGVYIIHFIVVGIIAAMLLDVTLPSLTKYAVLIVSAYVVSNLIVFLYKVTVQRVMQYV